MVSREEHMGVTNRRTELAVHKDKIDHVAELSLMQPSEEACVETMTMPIA